MLKKTMIIGIDPGKNGGIAVISNERWVSIDKMPADLYKLWDYFIGLGFPNLDKSTTFVAIENVHTMPTDSAKSMMTFGKHLGHLEMIFTLLKIDAQYLNPQQWQKFYEIKKDKGEAKQNYKNRLKQLAFDLVPNDKQGKITLATADAVLITYFYKEFLKELPNDENKDSRSSFNGRIPIL